MCVFLCVLASDSGRLLESKVIGVFFRSGCQISKQVTAHHQLFLDRPKHASSSASLLLDVFFLKHRRD